MQSSGQQRLAGGGPLAILPCNDCPAGMGWASRDVLADVGVAGAGECRALGVLAASLPATDTSLWAIWLLLLFIAMLDFYCIWRQSNGYFY
ncbi:hypothetical protein [Vogesella sp. LIG4]|uniref:hypothetical protein n=1 Tax=Vogesella sp. LIG4 TaxID=1192162 RepID=UPI0012FE4559|nr:hypothetical protein [Vogesella sp. LIG4]